MSYTPGPWTLELVQKWPFGVRVVADRQEILQQSAYCSSTEQRTRLDCELGVGFGGRDFTTIAEAQVHIANQDANARLITAAPDLLEAAKLAMEDCCDLIGTDAGNALEAAIAKAEGRA